MRISQIEIDLVYANVRRMFREWEAEGHGPVAGAYISLDPDGTTIFRIWVMHKNGNQLIPYYCSSIPFNLDVVMEQLFPGETLLVDQDAARIRLFRDPELISMLSVS